MLLIEIDSAGIGNYEPTGRACIVEITYVLRSTHDAPFEGIEVGYAVLGTRMVAEDCSHALAAFGNDR